MVRQARESSDTEYYHVMMRGNNREYIFGSEDQKKMFMGYLKKEADEGLLELVAWCLMDNHVHLVIKGKLADLTQAIKRINIKFAMGFNNRKNRIGHVFQDRYRSEAIKNDEHLLAVVRYVHNNPVKARMVKDAGHYAWSSYKDYCMNPELVSLGQRGLILDYFSGNLSLFEKFHYERDDEEYLEIKEDVEKYRMDRGQEIIAAYCDTQGIQEASEIAREFIRLEELIVELLRSTKLSHRKIASLLGTSGSRVHQVSLKRGS